MSLAPPQPDVITEAIRCKRRCLYFIHSYCKIKPAESDHYQPFHPWPSQQEVLNGLLLHKLVLLLKARQLGETTIVLAFALWQAIFWPNRTILLFSKDLKSSKDLILRLRMMARQLPRWLCPAIVDENKDQLSFINGSRFISFASNTSGGDSFTAQLAIVDEADLVHDLGLLLSGVKPTISAGGQLILLSRPDKSEPESLFKRLFKSSLAGENNYWSKFLPWNSRPGRDQAWYDREVADAPHMDWVFEQYPSTIEEALAPCQESKRIPIKWLESCYQPEDYKNVVESSVLVGLPGVRIYREPVKGRSYVIGSDPAGGKSNPNSDLSVSQVLDRVSQEQVAVLCGKIEPALLGDYTASLARYYNNAGVLVERNNHGGTVINHMRNNCQDVTLLVGHDRDVGFNKTDKTKILVMDLVAETMRNGGCTVHDRSTFHELANIESATNKAPDGQHDDYADAFGLGLWAAEQPVYEMTFGTVDIGPKKALYERVMSDLDVDKHGIVFIEVLGQWSVSLIAKVPLKDGTMRINVGNYESEKIAKYAHDVGCDILGYPKVHNLPPSEITTRDSERVKLVVRDKLKRTRQI